MANVFVSYSRMDIEFAKRLTGELQKSDLDFWIDWKGIPPTVDWWREIEKGIEEADAFIFLLSPDSVKSKVCGQEVDCAVKNGKRLIPLVVREIKGEETPPQLSHLNYVFFRENDDFDAAIQKLLTAIHTDYEWVQQHRWLQVRALDWERDNKDKSSLLRGKDLQDAEFQLAKNTSKEPHPTDLQREYVFASRKATDRQRRLTTGISIFAAIALASLAVFGLVQAGLATTNANEAKANLIVAQTAQVDAQNKQVLADNNAATAVANEQKAQAAQASAEQAARRAIAGQLALESKSFLDTYPQRALLLALEAVRTNQAAGEPVPPESEEALRLAFEKVLGIGINVEGFKTQVDYIHFASSKTGADNLWLVAGTTANNMEARIWNLDKLLNDPDYQPFRISVTLPSSDSNPKESPSVIETSPQDTWLVTNATDGYSLWLIADDAETRTPVEFQGRPVFPDPNDDTQVLEQLSGEAILWHIDPATLQKTETERLQGESAFSGVGFKSTVTENPQTQAVIANFLKDPRVLGEEADIVSSAISPDGNWIAASATDGSLRLWNSKSPEAFSLKLDQPAASTYIALSNDNQWLAIGHTIWRLEAGQPVTAYQIEGKSPEVGVFSPDSRWFIHVQGLYGSSFQTYVDVTLFDMSKIPLQPALNTIQLAQGDFTVQFSPNSQWAAFGGNSSASFVINLEDISMYPLPYNSDAVFTPDQNHLILSNPNPEIWALPGTPTGSLEKTGSLDPQGVSLISRNGRWLVSWGKINLSDPLTEEFKVWDVNCVIEGYPCQPFIVDAQYASFSPDSQTLMLGWYKSNEPGGPIEYVLWDMKPWEQDTNGQPVKVYAGDEPQFLPTVSSKGNLIVLQKNESCYPGGRPNSMALLNSTWGKYPDLDTFSTFDGFAFLKLSFPYAASGYGEPTYHIDYQVDALMRDGASYKPISLRGHESSISTNLVSPDERYVLTFSGGTGKTCDQSENILRLWDMEKMRDNPGTQPVVLPLTGTRFSQLAFSPDSNWVYVVDDNDVLHFFPTSIEALQKKACQVVGRNFIINEWERFFPHQDYRKTCENLPVHPSVNEAP